MRSIADVRTHNATARAPCTRLRAWLWQIALCVLFFAVSAPPADAQTVTGLVSLQGAHGRFVGVEANGSASAARAAVGATEQFSMLANADGTVSFRSAQGKYLVAEDSGTVNANRDAIGAWEKFVMSRNADGTVSFKTAHGKYMVAEPDGRLNANRDQIGPWEGFRLAQLQGTAAAPVAAGTPAAIKLELLTAYAPLVALAPGEEYMPASVEWAAQQMNRVIGPEGKAILVTRQGLRDPSDDSLPLFRGNLATAPVYAFWSEHESGVNLVYFFYYTYNRGKQVAGSIYGNHVSDWEHITVRLEKNGNGWNGWLPVKVYYAAHDGGENVDWNRAQKVGTHPVAYSAKGSHGSYASPGSREYGKALGTPLVDVTGNGGAQWETWRRVVAIDHNAKVLLNPPPGQDGARAYPAWLGQDYTNMANAANPLSAGVYRWGNPSMGGNTGDVIAGALTGLFKPSARGDVVRFVDGPTGPQEKDAYAFGEIPANPGLVVMACQGLSDQYAIVGVRGGYGFAPPEAHAKWDSLGCKTAPAAGRVPALCQHMSDTYGVNANITWGRANADIQGSWTAMNCQTGPALPPGPSVPLVYGGQYHLLNGYGHWTGGYLDVSGFGCEGNLLCVSTAGTSSRGDLTGTWMILPATAGRAMGQSVVAGDEIYLANLYGHVPSGGRLGAAVVNFGGFLDTRNAGCRGDLLCVSTAAVANRDPSRTGVWKIEAVNGSGPLLSTTIVTLQNAYNNYGGGYLNTNGAGCQNNRFCVSTSPTKERVAGSGTTQWMIQPR